MRSFWLLALAWLSSCSVCHVAWFHLNNAHHSWVVWLLTLSVTRYLSVGRNPGMPLSAGRRPSKLVKSRHGAAETGNDSRKREWRDETAVTVRRQVLLRCHVAEYIWCVGMSYWAESSYMAMRHALILFDLDISTVIMHNMTLKWYAIDGQEW